MINPKIINSVNLFVSCGEVSSAVAAVVKCVNGQVLRILPQYQVRICREANEAYVSWPLTGTGPSRGPEKGPSVIFTRFVFVKFCKRKRF